MRKIIQSLRDAVVAAYGPFLTQVMVEQEQTLLKQEKASLQKKLLDAAAAKPQQTGKIVM